MVAVTSSPGLIKWLSHPSSHASFLRWSETVIDPAAVEGIVEPYEVAECPCRVRPR